MLRHKNFHKNSRQNPVEHKQLLGSLALEVNQISQSVYTMMRDFRFLGLCLLLGSSFRTCLSDEAEDGMKNFFDGTIGQSMKGFGDFFKGVADGVKDKSEDGMGMLKSFSEGAKDKSEDAAESLKGFGEGLGDRFSDAKEKSEDTMKNMAESLGDRFSNAKEKLSETGEKMKEALGDAAEKSKKEFETAASEISKHASGAGEAMMKLFG